MHTYNLIVEIEMATQAISCRFEFLREKFQLRSDLNKCSLPKNFMGKGVIGTLWIMMVSSEHTDKYLLLLTTDLNLEIKTQKNDDRFKLVEHVSIVSSIIFSYR